MEKIDLQQIPNQMTYPDYVEKVNGLLKIGRTSTNDEATNPKFIPYTQMNLERMKQWDKMATLLPETLAQLAKIAEPMIWLDITEGWCGDASQVVPVIEKMAAANPNIRHTLIFRDEHPVLMDAFLTDGGRSIPKIIILDKNGAIKGTWGPRPKALQVIVRTHRDKMLLMSKEERKDYFEVAKTEVHEWYHANKTICIQQEFMAILPQTL